MTRTAASRSGVSAPEAIVALLLGLFLVHLGFSTMARLRTVREDLASRADGLVAMRVGRHVLRRELRWGRPGVDWSVEGDSLSLRAFRGTGLVCPSDTAGAELIVLFGGDRSPDPSKDSVLLLDAEGTRYTRELAAVTTTSVACGTASPGALQTWTLGTAAPPGSVVARLFERGSYHLTASALRYRRGASGRQPLTPEVWSDETAWLVSGGRLAIEARPSDSSAGQPWSAFLSWLD